VQDVVETRVNIPVADGIMAGLVWTPSDFSGLSNHPSLVFFHANGFCSSTYRGLLSGLAQQTGKVIAALDLRGHGRSQISDNPDEQDNWNRHAKDICEAVSIIAPNGCVVAGHSMGATSALLASARASHLVMGLALFDPVLAPPGFYLYAKLPWVFNNWRKHFPMARNAAKRRAVFGSRQEAITAYTGRGAFKSWSAQTISDYCDDGFKDLPEGGVTLSCAPEFEAACFAGQRHNPFAALAHVKGPARVLRASRNSTTVALLSKRLQRFGLEVETVPDTSHFLPMERPDVCQAAMADIMARCSPTSPQVVL
jgi:pimeloyl-ACP methyl ester carboxylesterase